MTELRQIPIDGAVSTTRAISSHRSGAGRNTGNQISSAAIRAAVAVSSTTKVVREGLLLRNGRIARAISALCRRAGTAGLRTADPRMGSATPPDAYMDVDVVESATASPKPGRGLDGPSVAP
jgi:hypothetical protein